jgi:hypothetical protein
MFDAAILPNLDKMGGGFKLWVEKVDGGWWRGLLLLVSLTCGMHVESWYPHGQTVLYITLQCFARCVSV